MFLKKLMLASAAVLMLAIAYHLGSSVAVAQSKSHSPIVGVSCSDQRGCLIVAEDGTVWGVDLEGGLKDRRLDRPFTQSENVWQENEVLRKPAAPARR